MAPVDPSTDPSKEVYNHGMAINSEDKKIQCCYCGEVVYGFNRLQHHLGGIRGNVVECPVVPMDVKDFFRRSVLSVKIGRLGKEIGDLCHLEPPQKRSCTSNGKANEVKLGNVTGFLNGWAKGQKRRLGNSVAGKSVRELTSYRNVVCTSEKGFSGKEGQDSATIMAKRFIARFFFENVVDYGAVTSYSFKSMMEISQKSGETLSIPSIAELKGWILDDELVDIQNYVKEVRLSWPRTGCSILLEGWDDHSGRSLVNIIVDCPEGPIYLRSADVSPSTKGANALELLVDAVLEEVGIQNVVQIIASTSSESMEAVSKQVIEKYRSLFWTVSTSHCISLMLENIAMTDSIRLTLDRAKTITKFIYNRADLLLLLRRHISSHNLVIPSKIKIAASFMTLENFLVERSNLQHMFTSSEWLNSSWALSVQGKEVANLIGDNSFWNDVIIAVKASIPLVKAVSLLYESDEPNIGFVYETMDQVKETISWEFGENESKYIPFWDIIDEIWNSILHSPLHAAGYFLNPKFHYTKDFLSDTEVASGFLVTVVRIVEEKSAQDKISQQMGVYGCCQGDFKLGIKNSNHDKLSPATWWSQFGWHCPHLQKFAVRVLSQTCKGADSYDLRRDLAEKLLSTGRNSTEQKRLHDLTYVHYNLKLKQFKTGAKYNIKANEIDPTDDWIVDELHLPELAEPGNGNYPLVNPDCATTSLDSNTVEEIRPSGVQPNMAPKPEL